MKGRVFNLKEDPLDLEARQGYPIFFCAEGKKYRAYFDFSEDGVFRISIHRKKDKQLIQSISIDNIGDIYSYFGAQEQKDMDFKNHNLLLKNRITVKSVELCDKEIGGVESKC